jgi:hypothetical protein
MSSTKVTDLFISQNPTTKMTTVLNIGTMLKIFDDLYDTIMAEIENRHDGSESQTQFELQAAKTALELKRTYSLLLENQNDVKRLYAKIHETRKEFGRGFSKLHAEIHREDKKVYDDLADKIIKLDEKTEEELQSKGDEIYVYIGDQTTIINNKIDNEVNEVNIEINRVRQELANTYTRIYNEVFNDPVNCIVFTDGRSDVSGRQVITHVKNVPTPTI